MQCVSACCLFSPVWLLEALWILFLHRILWRELSSVHRILQAKILERVAMLSSKRTSGARDGTHVSYVAALAGRFFTTSATWERK